jgi:hypothetical protein
MEKVDKVALNQSTEAKEFWANIPGPLQVKLLNNVWCGGSCMGNTGVAVESMSVERGDLIIRGKCTKCGSDVARLIEGDCQPQEEITSKTPRIAKLVRGAASPDISKPAAFRAGTKADNQIKGVKKLKVVSLGDWNPHEELFDDGEDRDERLPHPFDKILNFGARESWEMENILPGYGPGDFDCPIGVGIDIFEAGDWNGGVRHMKGLLKKDDRCLDAYAHLGNWHFEYDDLNKAKNFYKMGVAIALKSMGKKADGVFPWGFIENRPFLRCLHGLGITYYRQRKVIDALPIFEKMIWLNPRDNQGARFLINSMINGVEWKDCE